MEFGIKKCGVLMMKKGKLDKRKSNGIILPSGETIKSIEDSGYKYLGILECDSIKEKEMKESFCKEYYRRVNLVSKSNLNGRNKISAVNTWAVSLMRYGAGIIDWKMSELEKMNRRTRKILTMNKELHPKSDVDRLYVPRKERGRVLISCKGCVLAEENNLGWYLKHQIEPFLVEVREQETIESEDTIEPKQFKVRETERTFNAWREKRMYEQHLRDVGNYDVTNSWKWLTASDLKGCTEALICSAQEQALRTINIKHFMQNVWSTKRNCNTHH